MASPQKHHDFSPRSEAPCDHGPGRCGETQHNDLLQALPESMRQRWMAKMEAVELPPGMVLAEPGVRVTHVYFPTTAIVSLQQVSQLGQSSEIAVIGNEGMVGTWVAMGSATTNLQAVVHGGGEGLRMRADDLLWEFDQAGPAMHLLLRYVQALMTQTSQTAACNRHHSLLQQLCRRLLLSLDRLSSNRIAMTQDVIANMLGVRRAGVTEAAGTLRQAGVIRTRQGQIDVLDRAELEHHTCECYAVVSKEYARLLPATIAV